MAKRVVWLTLSCVFWVALVLASCQPVAPTGPAEGKTVRGEVVEKEAAGPADVGEKAAVAAEEREMVRDALGRLVEKPQYGGTLTLAVKGTFGYDPVDVSNFFPCFFAYEPLIWHDWARGPSGTGETLFSTNFTPPEFFTGALAESWEVLDLQTVVFHLRKGVCFMDKPPVNGREMTADDVVFTYERNIASAKHTIYGTKVTVTRVDKYTVRFDFEEPSVTADDIGTGNNLIVPRDAVEAHGDLTDWQNMVGTGPFVVTEVVPASSITYARNPRYWQSDPLLPDNSLPYYDYVRQLVILDPATMQTAMRVGKIDQLEVESLQDVAVLRATAPQLKSKKLSPRRSYIIHMKLGQAPYDSTKVRQALSMAIDYEAIARDYYKGDATLLNWPFMPDHVGAYIPLDELPADLKALYSYDVEGARQLLAEAGYPRGFKTKVSAQAREVEWLSIVKNYWDAIGVDMEIDVQEVGAYLSLIVGKTYTDMSASRWGNVSDSAVFIAYGCGHIYNYSQVCDDIVEEASATYFATIDPAARTSLLRDLNLHLIKQQYYIALPTPSNYVFWQPWLKGYNGELCHAGGISFNGVFKYTWVDQKLKAATGR